MKIKFYLKRPNEKNQTAIFARVCYNNNILKIYTEESIKPKYWNTKTHMARNTPEFSTHPEFNERLNKIESSINRVFIDYKNKHDNATPSPAILKPLIDEALKRGGERITLVSYFQDFVTRSMTGQRIDPKSKKAIRHGVGKGYNTTMNHLIEFDNKWRRKLDFETIDLEFHADFTKYLNSAPIQLSLNTIGDHFKRLKAVMAEATERGHNANMAFKSKYFVKQWEEADTIYLTDEELAAMQKVDLTKNEKLDNVRDLFLISCNTGLRFSDLSALRPKNINDGYIRIKQIKTGDPVTIPVKKVVREILEKRNGETPRVISNVKMNKYLKELGELVTVLQQPATKTSTKGGHTITATQEKWKLITTHTARRSFATNEYKRKILDVLQIMSVTGHKTEAAFLRYIRVTPEQHAQDIKKLWDKKESKLKVA